MAGKRDGPYQSKFDGAQQPSRITPLLQTQAQPPAPQIFRMSALQHNTYSEWPKSGHDVVLCHLQRLVQAAQPNPDQWLRITQPDGSVAWKIGQASEVLFP